MTESDQTPAAAPRKSAGLNAMRVADLKAMAGAIGIAGAESMRKAALIEAIRGAGTPVGDTREAAPEAPAGARARDGGGDRPAGQDSSGQDRAGQDGPGQEGSGEPGPGGGEQSGGKGESGGKSQKSGPKSGKKKNADAQGQPVEDTPAKDQQKGQAKQQQKGQGKEQQKKGQDKGQQQGQSKEQQGSGQQEQSPPQDQSSQQGEGEEGGSRRSRRRRGRDNRDQPAQPRGRRNEPDTQVLDDDVLVPAAGILDVLENYAFVRTSGYLPGPEDVYLSLSLVRKFGLRRGDAVKGQVRQPREGERREKFNPMVRIDAVNSLDPEASRTRPEFSGLTAVHPSQALQLERGADDVAGRVLDVAVPLARGQRCLVRAEPGSGRTDLLRSVAASISANHPDVHLMAVLLHQRPEEITDARRELTGEVVATGFDQPAADHLAIAELAVERARRLVELGTHVVLVLDGLSRLARAQQQAGPRSGAPETLGVQAAKEAFGAGRALEEGGSLTVVATLGVGTVSEADAQLAEELEGTATAEVSTTRALAAAGLTPAVDLLASGTRHLDAMLDAAQVDALRRLRGVWSTRDDAAGALGLLLERIGATRSNTDMLARVTGGGR